MMSTSSLKSIQMIQMLLSLTVDWRQSNPPQQVYETKLKSNASAVKNRSISPGRLTVVFQSLSLFVCLSVCRSVFLSLQQLIRNRSLASIMVTRNSGEHGHCQEYSSWSSSSFSSTLSDILPSVLPSVWMCVGSCVSSFSRTLLY